MSIKARITNFVLLKLFGRISFDVLIQRRGLRIGKNFKILQDCIIDDSHCSLIKIGDNVTLAPRVHILAHDASTKLYLGYTKIGKVNIGNNVFIGAGSIILPNVNIGNDVIIGAGSVVTKDIPDNTVAVGNPCKVISTMEEYIKTQEKLFEVSPKFDESYTLRSKYYSVEKAKEMNNKIGNGFGYIV